MSSVVIPSNKDPNPMESSKMISPVLCPTPCNLHRLWPTIRIFFPWILQARILGAYPAPSPRDLPDSGSETEVQANS